MTKLDCALVLDVGTKKVKTRWIKKRNYHHSLPGTNNATGQGVSHGAQPDVLVGAQLTNSFLEIGSVQVKTLNIRGNTL